MENADRTKHMCAIAAACLLCDLFEGNADRFHFQSAGAGGKRVCAIRKYTDESTEVVRSETGRCIKEITVCDRLGCGTWRQDEGAVSDDGKLEEKEYNLAVVKEIARLLEQSGVKVYCTRTTDRTVSKKARVRLANKRQADMLVSVHCNASDARKHFVRGIEVLYSKRDNGAGYTNKQLAAKLLKKTVAATGLPARGVIRREDLYLMHHAKVPAVIVETGYLTNPSDYLYMRQEKE